MNRFLRRLNVVSRIIGIIIGAPVTELPWETRVDKGALCIAVVNRSCLLTGPSPRSDYELKCDSARFTTSLVGFSTDF